MLKFSHKEFLKRSHVVILVRGFSESGIAQYAYVSVPGDKAEQLLHELQHKGADLQEFGNIVKSGSGMPTRQIMQEMEEKYGVNHNLENDIIELAEEIVESNT